MSTSWLETFSVMFFMENIEIKSKFNAHFLTSCLWWDTFSVNLFCLALDAKPVLVSFGGTQILDVSGGPEKENTCLVW